MNTIIQDQTSRATECPAWCAVDHDLGETERYHRSAEVETPLGTFMLSSTSGSRDGEDEPANIVSVHDGGNTEWRPDDARKAASDFASAMFNLVDQAFGAGERRPFWLTEPCPAWCQFADDHPDGAHPADRVHYGEIHRVTLSLLPTEQVVSASGEEVPEPEYASVHLRQHVEAKAPTIMLGKGQSADELPFTLAEARQLIATLQRVISDAEQQATA